MLAAGPRPVAALQTLLISYVRPRMHVGSSIPNLVRVALGAVYNLTDGIGLIVRRW